MAALAAHRAVGEGKVERSSGSGRRARGVCKMQKIYDGWPQTAIKEVKYINMFRLLDF